MKTLTTIWWYVVAPIIFIVGISIVAPLIVISNMYDE